jgi:hypothetical protein
VEARSRRHPGRIDESLLVARLEHLEALRLAHRVAPAAWTLRPGWQEQLCELAVRGDILKQIHMAVGGDRSRYRIVRPGCPLEDGPGKDGTVLLARVASKGLADELKGTFYAVLETASGRAYYVPLEARTAQDVSVGDIVSMKSVPVDRMPTPINAGIAQEKRGADPDCHRLLVRKQPLSLQEQVGHGGPVWLDSVDRGALSHWRFGADVRRALDRRREALQGMGIAPDDPRREAELRERERRTRGEEIAARTGQQFLANIPDRLRGRLQPDSRHPTYAVVSDGTRFVLLPASAATHALAGKRVSLSRDAAGRVTVHALEADRGR